MMMISKNSQIENNPFKQFTYENITPLGEKFYGLPL